MLHFVFDTDPRLQRNGGKENRSIISMSDAIHMVILITPKSDLDNSNRKNKNAVPELRVPIKVSYPTHIISNSLSVAEGCSR